MKKYSVQVRVRQDIILTYDFEVDAENAEQAELIAHDAWVEETPIDEGDLINEYVVSEMVTKLHDGE